MKKPFTKDRAAVVSRTEIGGYEKKAGGTTTYGGTPKVALDVSAGAGQVELTTRTAGLPLQVTPLENEAVQLADDIRSRVEAMRRLRGKS